MRRREFVAFVGCAAVWPSAAGAQQPVLAVVGLLSSAQLDDRQIDAIRQGLKEAGYIEGRNVAIKYRSADSHFDRLPALAADLVADPVAAIVDCANPWLNAADGAVAAGYRASGFVLWHDSEVFASATKCGSFLGSY